MDIPEDTDDRDDAEEQGEEDREDSAEGKDAKFFDAIKTNVSTFLTEESEDAADMALGEVGGSESFRRLMRLEGVMLRNLVFRPSRSESGARLLGARPCQSH